MQVREKPTSEVDLQDSYRGSTVGPFLRWAGGKAHYANSIVDYLPQNFQGVYYEPFLGAASVFLAYQPSRARLSDLNKQLIDTYIQVRDNPKLLYDHLMEYTAKDSEAFFYRTRDEYNSGRTGIRQAARFIYLNKACFNGIFRVNRDGVFNVPYGQKRRLAIPSLSCFAVISNLLRKADLDARDYRSAVSRARSGDLVYLDPPYPPLDNSSSFTHYTKERFNWLDQAEVAAVAADLSRLGSLVLITNADTEEIRALYKDWLVFPIQRTRWITCAREKHKVGELIITNYNPQKEVSTCR